MGNALDLPPTIDQQLKPSLVCSEQRRIAKRQIENAFVSSNKNTTKQVSTIIENPYVKSRKGSVVQASATEPVVEPLRIDNPFVVQVGR